MTPKDTAFIFIEFQNEFCAEKGFCHPLVQAELARLKTLENGQKLLNFVRTKEFTVIHCPFVFDPIWYDAMNPGGLQDTFYHEKAFQPDSWGATIIEPMRPLENEVVLIGKHGLNGFAHTGLHDILQKRRIRNLFVCGFLTNLCVQTTAIAAYDYGYRTRIVADACASGSPQIQEYVETTICPVLGGFVKTKELTSCI